MSNYNNKYDEIDLTIILRSILRQKNILVIVTFISTILMYSYLSSKKPIWRGSFNILTKSDSKSSNNSSIANLGFFEKSFGVSSDNVTEKLVLSSPLILNPVFKNVLNYRKENSLNTEITFKSWASKISVNFENNSNILTITHQNKDKVLLLNTLEDISKTYKEYSKNKQLKDILKTKEYLLQQKEVMTKKAAISRRLFNEFSIKNNLGNVDGFIPSNSNNNVSIPLGETSQDPMSQITTNAKPTVGSNKKIDPGSRFQSQFNRLNILEAEETNLSQYLKPESNTLKKLRKDIEYLKANLKRPNELLIKFDELANQSTRDTAFLDEILNNLEFIKLEEIKSPDPWILISEPTIDKNPISLSNKKRLILSFIGSFFFGCIFVLIKEKLSRIIYEKSNIESLLNTQYIETIDKENKDLSLKILMNHISNKNNELTGIVNYNGQSNLDFIEQNFTQNKNLIFLDLNNEEIERCNNILLIIEEGKYTSEDISLMNKYTNLYKNKLLGWFYLK